jgi:ketosteroid isomerase-like protein
MTETVEIAARLYAALHNADHAALSNLLHPSFTGRVSQGMPLGVGGTIDGPNQMIRGVWGVIATAFDTAPIPDEYLQIADDRVIVLGYYRGRARTTNRPYQAAFVHDLTITDDLIARLTQITDTKPWYDACVAPVGHTTSQ